MSQEHNALSWPGLEPRLSDLEPSALTTGPPDKAMALACLWYSWPRMLKVAPCTVVWSYGRTVVRSDGHTVIRSYGHTVIWSYGRTVIRSYGRRVVRLYGRMGVQSYNQIFLAWWVTTILYNYGATLCKLCFKSYFFLWMNQKLTKWSSQEIEIEKEAQKKSQAWTGFKLSCDRQ